jgi:hypothetical protein
LAQVEEDDEEPALLMAQACTTPAPAMVVQQSIAPARAMLVQQSDAPTTVMVVQQNITLASAIVVHDSTITAPEHAPLHIDEPKANRLLNPATRRVRIAHDVIFSEERRWDWAADDGKNPSSNFDVEYISRHATRVPSQVSSSAGDKCVSSSVGLKVPQIAHHQRLHQLQQQALQPQQLQNSSRHQ